MRLESKIVNQGSLTIGGVWIRPARRDLKEVHAGGRVAPLTTRLKSAEDEALIAEAERIANGAPVAPAIPSFASVLP